MKRRSFVLALTAVLMGAGALSGRAEAGLVGVVRSVDVPGGKLVVTETGSGRDVVLSFNDRTIFQNNAAQLYPVNALKVGDSVGVADVGGVATQVIISPIPQAGNVLTVDPDQRRLVLKEIGTGRQVELVIGDQTKIQTLSGKAIALADIRKADDAGFAQAGGVATMILVSQAPIVGLVDSVDADAKKLVVTESGTEKDLALMTDDATRIETGAGKALELKDLKRGDGVSIAHNGNLAGKIVVNVKPDEVTGHVKSVGADEKTLIVNEIATGADVTVLINDKTTIVTTAGKNLAFKDLKKGDGVGVAHHGGIAEKIVVSVKPVR